MKAIEANKLAEKYYTVTKEESITYIINKIKKTSKIGGYSYLYKKMIYKETEEKLIALGYEVSTLRTETKFPQLLIKWT